MSEFKSHIEVKISSERSFGLVLTFVFSSIGLYPTLNGNGMRLWALLMAMFLFIIAWYAPKVFSIPNKIWHDIGLKLSSILSPVAMALIYFIAVMPTGLIFNLFRPDLSSKEDNPRDGSYWVRRDITKRSMKDQF